MPGTLEYEVDHKPLNGDVFEVEGRNKKDN
jgi:hypothetical protein